MSKDVSWARCCVDSSLVTTMIMTLCDTRGDKTDLRLLITDERICRAQIEHARRYGTGARSPQWLTNTLACC
eukprot:scaffold2549_cov108-Isochrysis_galbana.AAC.16